MSAYERAAEEWRRYHRVSDPGALDPGSPEYTEYWEDRFRPPSARERASRRELVSWAQNVGVAEAADSLEVSRQQIRYWARQAGMWLPLARQATMKERAEALRIYSRRGAREASRRTGRSIRTIEGWARLAGVTPRRAVRRLQERQKAKSRRIALEKARAQKRRRTAPHLQPGLIDSETLLERGAPEWAVTWRDLVELVPHDAGD